MPYSVLIFDWEGTLGETLLTGSPSLLPGVAEMLRALKAQDYQLAVATNRTRSGLDKALQVTGLSDIFICSRTISEAESKPSPDMVLQILWQCNCQPQRALMIGDSTSDAQMAQAATVDFMGVGPLFQNDDPFLKIVTDLPQHLVARALNGREAS